MISALCMIHSPAFVKMLFGEKVSRKKFPFQVWDFGLLAQTLSKWASDNFNFTSDNILIYIEMEKNEEREHIDTLNRGPLAKSIWLIMDSRLYRLYSVETRAKWKGIQASEVHIRLNSNNWVQQTDKFAGVLRVLTTGRLYLDPTGSP